jgi:drug/metabolite transporter (DMT)-like permease
MKLVLIVLGVILLILAGVYFMMPADQLPSFLPGHEAGVTRVHTKHGIVAAVAGVVLIAAGWWIGRR